MFFDIARLFDLAGKCSKIRKHDDKKIQSSVAVVLF